MVKIVERITYRDDGTLENTDRKIEISGKNKVNAVGESLVYNCAVELYHVGSGSVYVKHYIAAGVIYVVHPEHSLARRGTCENSKLSAQHVQISVVYVAARFSRPSVDD